MKDEKTKRSPRVIGTFEERIVTWACAQDVLDRMKRSPQFKGIDLDHSQPGLFLSLPEPASNSWNVFV